MIFHYRRESAFHLHQTLRLILLECKRVLGPEFGEPHVPINDYCVIPANINICISIVQRRPNVFDVGPTLYKCYTNVLCCWDVISRTFIFRKELLRAVK